MLLLPRAPDSVRVSGGSPRWHDALAWWAVPAAADGVPADLEITGHRAGGISLLLSPPGPAQVWHVRRLGLYETALAPEEHLGLLGPARVTRRERAAPSERLLATAGRLVRLHDRDVLRRRVTVRGGGRGAEPAVLRAARTSGVPHGPYYLSVSDNPFKRAAFFVFDEVPTGPAAVVKVSRVPRAEADPHEQLVLHRLASAGLGARTPRPLGCGHAGPVAWWAEGAVQGRQLQTVLRDGVAPPVFRALVDDVAGSLTALASATRGPARWTAKHDDDVLPLRGAATAVADLVQRVDSPGVLAHRDLGYGANTLADGATVQLLDWETAREGAPPLLDLLPLLCNSVAWHRGVTGVDAHAALVLDLLAGRDRDSAWILSLVRSYLHAAQVPLDQAGLLALLAWAHEVSSPLVYVERVAREGMALQPTASAAAAVLDAFLRHPDLGPRWSALTAGAA
jgi:hypothetical protein